MSINEDFTLASNQLLEQTCWGISGGEGVGSIIKLNFGDKIPRKKTLTNPHLTEEQRLYEAELSLLIWCSWRLKSNTDIICSSEDDNSNEGPMLNGLKKLIGKNIKKIIVTPPKHDMILNFEDGYALNILCDQYEYENYSFYTPNKIYTIEPQGEISIETPEN